MKRWIVCLLAGQRSDSLSFLQWHYSIIGVQFEEMCVKIARPEMAGQFLLIPSHDHLINQYWYFWYVSTNSNETVLEIDGKHIFAWTVCRICLEPSECSGTNDLIIPSLSLPSVVLVIYYRVENFCIVAFFNPFQLLFETKTDTSGDNQVKKKTFEWSNEK